MCEVLSLWCASMKQQEQIETLFGKSTYCFEKNYDPGNRREGNYWSGMPNYNVESGEWDTKEEVEDHARKDQTSKFKPNTITETEFKPPVPEILMIEDFQHHPRTSLPSVSSGVVLLHATPHHPVIYSLLNFIKPRPSTESLQQFNVCRHLPTRLSLSHYQTKLLDLLFCRWLVSLPSQQRQQCARTLCAYKFLFERFFLTSLQSLSCWTSALCERSAFHLNIVYVF